MRLWAVLVLLLAACVGQNEASPATGGGGAGPADDGGKGGAAGGGQGGMVGCGGTDLSVRQCACANAGLTGQALLCCVWGGQLEACGDASDEASHADAADAAETTNPCSGKTCGESCHSWRVNAEACDIYGECSEANYALCTCNPCSPGCQFLNACDAGLD